MLADHAVRRDLVDSLDRETVRVVLAEHKLKPWREGKKMWCVPELDDEFVFFDKYAAAVDALSHAGYLVVAPVYERLRTRGFHSYLQTPTEARNVVDGVAAARAQIPEAGRKWVTIGHSQGGHAALGVGS